MVTEACVYEQIDLVVIKWTGVSPANSSL